MIVDEILFFYFSFMILVHVVIVIGVVRECEQSKRVLHSNKNGDFKVSVLIPAKDEEANLPALFDSLEGLLAPNVQIVLADDRSSDGTRRLMDEFASRHSNVVVLSNTDPPPENMNPKHSVLAAASKYAAGDIIMLTDADCTVSRGWIETVCRYFQNPKVGLVFSVVTTEPGAGILRKYQTYDHIQRFFYVVGAAGLGSPSGGFGNNMAIRRSALDDVGGFETIGFSLVEDAQLVAAVRNTRRWQVAACPFREALVCAKPQKRLSDVARQEVRWSAGAIFGTDLRTSLLYSFMFTMPLLGALSFVCIPFHGVAAFHYLASVFCTAMVASAGACYLRCSRNFWLWVVPCSMLTTLFYGFTYLAAFFVRSVNWKGTKVKR